MQSIRSPGVAVSAPPGRLRHAPRALRAGSVRMAMGGMLPGGGRNQARRVALRAIAPGRCGERPAQPVARAMRAMRRASAGQPAPGVPGGSL